MLIAARTSSCSDGPRYSSALNAERISGADRFGRHFGGQWPSIQSERSAPPKSLYAFRNLLRAIAAAPFHFVNSIRSPRRSRQPIPSLRDGTKAEYEAFRQVPGTKFRKAPVTQYLLTLALGAFRKRCGSEVTVIRANNAMSLTRPWGLYQLETGIKSMKKVLLVTASLIALGAAAPAVAADLAARPYTKAPADDRRCV